MNPKYECELHGHSGYFEDCPVCRSYKNAPVKEFIKEAFKDKPRDIWLFMDSAVEYKHFGPQRVKQLGDRQIHLIEKTAYDKLKAKADNLYAALIYAENMLYRTQRGASVINDALEGYEKEYKGNE